MNAKKELTHLVEKSGITINGPETYDICVHDDGVYNRIFSSGRLGLGESFMEKQWDVDRLDVAVEKLFQSKAAFTLRSPSTWWLAIKARLFNLQSRARSFEVGEEHYDYGNDMYQSMLGPSMIYTCADFRGLDLHELDKAQEQKLKLICDKLDLQPGKRLLDIGCGWGGLMKYAAEHYGVECVGVSVSQEQTAWARESFGDLPCSIHIIDYRDFEDEQGFDYITSIEMIEAVGAKNFGTYFTKIHSLLKDDGQVLIQAIVDPQDTPRADPWIDKYIFPNGILPSEKQLRLATQDLFVWQEIDDITESYDHTLMAWWYNLEEAYPTLNKQNPDKYNERFLRMMKYYLQSCAALARTRNMYDWQIHFTKK